MNQLRAQLAAEGETIGGLFARLIEDAKRLIRAELDYYKLLLTGRAMALRTAAIMIVVALFLVQASLTTLVVGLGLALWRLFGALGIAGGVIIAAVLGLAISGLLVRVAVARIAAASKPPEEGSK